MNRQQINDHAMMVGTYQTLIKNADLYQDKPVFKEAVNDFASNLKNIDDLLLEQERYKQISGIVSDKNMIRSFTTDKCIQIIAAIEAFSEATSNHQLKSVVHYPPSVLKTSNDASFYTKAKVIYDTAAGIQTILEQYGISANLIAELNNDIESFNKYLGRVKAMFARQIANTVNITTAFRKTKSHLKNTLDRLVKATFFNSSFASGYFIVRIPYKLGNPSTIVRGVITAANGHPIKHCKVELLNYPQPGTHTIRYSSKQGNFAFKKLTLNKVVLRITMAGYNPMEMEKTVLEKKVNQINIILHPLQQFQSVQ